MLYSFNDAEAPERHDLQYFEMFGNRGIYHQGWSAVTKHKTPWLLVGEDVPAFDDDVWELYDGAAGDYSQARDLAKEQPDVLAQLQRLWLIEATKYNVLPLDDRSGRAVQPRPGGTPDPDPRQLPAVLPRHGPAVGEQRREHQEQVVLGHGRSRRARGRRRGRDHRPGRTLRRLGRLRQGRPSQVRLQRARHPGVHHRRHLAGPGRQPPAADGVRLRRGGLAKGGDVTLFHDGTEVGKGRVEATQPMVFSADETTDIGYESGTTVTPDYTATAAASPASSTGSSSTPAPTTTTTTSTRRSDSASPWRGSQDRGLLVSTSPSSCSTSSASKDIPTDAEQQTKTKTALEFFSAELHSR